MYMYIYMGIRATSIPGRSMHRNIFFPSARIQHFKIKKYFLI